jgi:HEXXH motif-containing protein
MTAVTALPPELAERARQLSMPGPVFDEPFFEAVVLVHAQEIVAAFVDCYGGDVAKGSSRLTAAIAPPWDATLPAWALWDPAIGAAERVLESGEGEPVQVAALIGLRFAEAGLPGEWSASFDQELTPRWGRWLLPRCERVAVRSDGRSARVETGTATLTFTAQDGAWTTDGAEQLVSVPGEASMHLLPESAVRKQLEIEDEFHSVVAFPEPSDAIAGIFGDAMSLLRGSAPEYHDWVARIVRMLVPCECGESRTRSSSWREAPGAILISTAQTAPAVAEMLVHESCHQYLYVAKRLGDLVTGTDSELYYSPAVARPRPLDKVLLAYHAFANVLLLYEALRRSPGGEALSVDDAIAKMRADVDVLEAPLRDNEGLSNLGLALAEPLMERLRE